MSVETTEDAGNRLWHELGGEVVGRLADAALECCLIIDGRGAVRWASSGLCRRLDCTLPSLLGHGADKVIADLSPDLTQADIDALLAGGNRVLTTSGAQGGRVALQAYLQEVSGAVPEESFKVLILFDVTTLIEQLSTAERARAAIEHRLNYDVETGLPNERRLMEVLHAALRRPEDAGAPREAVGLMLVEVLDFDQILDIYGTDIGNEVIQELVAAVSCVLDSDTFTARTRQNEFAVLLPRVTSTQALVTTAENLVGQLAFEVETGTGDCRVSSVLSVSQMLPGAGSADQILNNARIAMSFRELPRRAGQVRLYEPEMRAALEARSRTYNELFAAIGRDEIVPFFQPQVRLSDRTVVGFEVLVRWRHPEQGLVPPGLFLEIAEETGLLPQIDSIVMHKALQCLATWHADGFPDARISLNCTGDSLRDENYVDVLLQEMDRNGLSPRHVAIEILENVLFGDETDIARITLKDLRDRGFYLEIDDFGTGQASISHLITLNANAVKLDRSLIRNIETDNASRLVVEATLALSRNLGLATLAEGTETEEQMALLENLGCDYAQGFGIAKPMPFEDCSAWLHRHAPRQPDEARATGG